MKKYFVSAALLCSLVIAGCGGKDKIDYKSDLAEINIESGETIIPPEISFDPNALTFAIAINVKNNNDKYLVIVRISC